RIPPGTGRTSDSGPSGASEPDRLMRYSLSSLMGVTAIVVASACIDEPEPEPAREPPEGTLVYEGKCARVFQSFEGYLCQGTSERLDVRACVIRDHLGGGPDLPRID